MITIRWAAFVLFLMCMGVASTGVRSWLLGGLATALFLIFMLTFDRRPRAPRPRPRSNWFVQDISEDHPDALGSLDLRERAGRRAVSPFFDQTTAGGKHPSPVPRIQRGAPGGPPTT